MRGLFHTPSFFGKTNDKGGMKVKKKVETEDLRLDPEKRLCPQFDATSIKHFSAPDRGEMGVRVLDNCAEEHIM